MPVGVYPRKSIEQRFWEKVSKKGHAGGCWHWTSNIDASGYGQFRANANTVGAHRFAFGLTFGEFDESLCVCHRCDNPCCVNPKHLFLGTTADNMRDRVKKGRSARGENHGFSVLTGADVLAIRCEYAAGKCSQATLAKKYATARANISMIVNRRSWQHI